MRKILVSLHRWVGLGIAVFLFVAGTTGAIIAWEHELDAWLNPHLYYAKSGNEIRVTPLELAERTERNDPMAVVTYLPLGVEAGGVVKVYVSPAIVANSSSAQKLDYSQISYDPGTGQEQGRRLWGAFSLASENLLPFIYKLHYSLHLPDIGALPFGGLLMGLIAIAWTIDCFVALAIAFPSRKRWHQSFKFQLKKGWRRANFDLHRSTGVWAWLLLLPLAFTAISMNLGPQVVKPLVSLFSELTPDPYISRAGAIKADGQVFLERAKIISIAEKEAQRRGIESPPGAVFLAPDSALYGIGFFEPGDDHADGKIANPWLSFDAYTGEFVHANLPWQGTGGDVFMQLQFPIHSGRIFGIPGRFAITILGLAIAMLSITGIIIWARRQMARRRKLNKKVASMKAIEPENSPASSQAHAA